MKTYFASQSYYPYIGGVSTYLLNLQKELKKRGNKVIELHLRTSGSKDHEVVEGIDTYRVPKKPLDKNMLKGYSKFKEAIWKESHGEKGSFSRVPIEMEGYDDFIQINEAFGEEVSEVIKHNPPDIIHIHDFQLIYLYRYVPRGTPLIFTWHIPLYRTISAHLKKFLVKHLMQYDKIIFSSKEYIDAAVQIGIPEKKCELIYPICNTNLFQPMDIDKSDVLNKYDIPIDSKVILSVQRIDNKSGHEQLINAMPKILEKEKNAVLVFVGGKSMSSKLSKLRQSYHDEVKRLIKELKLKDKIIFTGNIDYHSLPKLYNAADLVALCSKSEGFGLSITEAMSCKKPVVGTNTGGIPIQIKNGKNGYLVKVGDDEETASKILKILSSEKLRKEMGAKSLQIIEKNFKLDLAVDKHVHLYKKVLSDKIETRVLEKMDINELDALITDFDRTITDKPGELKQHTVDMLSKLNVNHILATGRYFNYVKKLAKKFKLWQCIICENGAVIYFPKSNKTITIDSDTMKKAREILRKNGIKATYGNVIVSIPVKKMERVKKLLEKLKKNLNYVMNVDDMMISPKYVDKGQGVKIALNYLELSAENTILVGDAENDIDLFRIPGFKVAVANAHPRLRLLSDQIMQKSGADGAIEIVEKLLKKA